LKIVDFMDLLPIFPLPSVVLFPNVFLPLHIFEPRYRDMVSEAIAGDRVIGMALLKPKWEQDYEGRPPVYQVGCSGLITHVERLSDGRFNIVLRGLERFRIRSEDHTRSYRRAVVEAWPEPEPTGSDRLHVNEERKKLEALVAPSVERAGMDSANTSAMSDADVINALAQYLDLEPAEKQALLERPCIRTRAHSLVELLEMKIMAARTPGGSRFSH